MAELIRAVMALRPGVTWRDGMVNGYSMETIAETYQHADPIPSLAECQAWLAENITAPGDTYSCSPWQIRKALSAAGIRQQVEDMVAASTDQAIKDGWAYATVFRSDDPFVISFGAALGMSTQELNTFIRNAEAL